MNLPSQPLSALSGERAPQLTFRTVRPTELRLMWNPKKITTFCLNFGYVIKEWTVIASVLKQNGTRKERAFNLNAL